MNLSLRFRSACYPTVETYIHVLNAARVQEQIAAKKYRIRNRLLKRIVSEVARGYGKSAAAPLENRQLI